MPSGFMPKGTVLNHWTAGSFASQKIAPDENDSILPWDAASKHSNGPMIWPPGNTSILNRPPLVSSTICAKRRAAFRNTSSVGGNAVDIRHWIFGWAMTFGASTTAAAPAATSIPPALTMNLRRSVMTEVSSSPDVLLIGTLGDVIPGPYQALELREGSGHLPSHRAPFRLCPHLVGRELFELAQDGRRE